MTGDCTCRPQQPTAFMMEALWMTLYGIPEFTALSTRSLWVVALQEDAVSQRDGRRFWPMPSTHPNGSPTTRSATSVTWASFRISSACCSTRSLSATISSRP